jgi:hypothetical protein
MSPTDMDDISRAAWDRFRASVQDELRRSAPPAKPMPIFCNHEPYVITSVRDLYTVKYRRCHHCPAMIGVRIPHRDPYGVGVPELPQLSPWVTGWTMPAAPHGTTMDVITGGTQ